MPSGMHPQAKFDPIPPDLDLHDLVDRSPNFDWVLRIPLVKIRRLGSAGFEKLVQLHVIEGGRPLVIEGWDKVLPSSLFSAHWLENTYDKKQENVRDINAQADITMTTGHYLRAMAKLTNQWTPSNFRDERRQRLYLKDIDCPPEWFNHLKKVIPPNVFYMNDNISETPATQQNDDSDIFGAPEKTIAVAGDLMSSLPEEMRAQNLMCYIGHEGTYTPAHREMCASLGQNIMVEASKDENGEKAGSSIWFMTETKDREVVREYFLSMLGHDIEIEKHFAQVNAWKKANFPVHIVEQKAGDFVLIPPLAPHQVWNRGTRTMKVAWNRTTVDTLGLALQEALPKARLVCRDEQYKNKAIIYFTLEKYYNELQTFDETTEDNWLGLGQDLLQNNSRSKRMLSDFKQLFRLFTDILVSEMFGQKQANIEHVPFDSNITCSYCRSNIFNKFLTCKHCVRQLINGDEDTYDICMECYAMGRSCVCISGLQWCDQWNWSELVEKHELWRSMIIQQDGFVDINISPPPLEVAKRLSRKKTVAQICQEQLRERPWNDISKPAEQQAPESEPEPEVDDEGRVKKKKYKRKAKKGEVYKCHTCIHKDNTWKLQYCTTCSEAYCYGVLWRAFDIMPQTAMEAEYWQCPKCLGFCNCGACRRSANQQPYTPKNTLLGHDTRPVADDRSVEAVVDFRLHNLNWLKANGEENRSKDTKRMQLLKEKADAEKSKDLMELEAAGHEATARDGEMNDAGSDDDAPEHDESAMQHNNTGPDDQGSMVPMADMSMQWDQNADPDASSYPDPSAYPDPSIMNNNRMMGMGFYDQDESENRILFDAFDASEAANADPANDSQMTEHIKKTLRLAKRRAKQNQEDDPDFRAPKRTYHKKKPVTGNLGPLANLDPALMDALGGCTETTTPQSGGTPAPAIAPAADEQPVIAEISSEVMQTKQPARTLPVDPLRPTLRHAKPIASYVDHEEELIEDPNDIVPSRPYSRAPKPRSTDAEYVSTVDVDLVADAVLGLSPVPGEEQLISATEDRPVTRKRGRLSGIRRGVATESDAVLPPATIQLPSRPSPESRKRLRMERAQADGDVSMQDIDDENSDAEGQWQQATGVRARDDDNDSDADFKQSKPAAAKPTGKRRGRPPKAKPAQPAVDDDSGDELRVVTPPPPRRRGRPPGRKSEPVAPFAVQATDMQFLSMAERMALKGKKIKIRGRKSMPARTQSPSVAADTSKVSRPARAESLEAGFSAGESPEASPGLPINRAEAVEPPSYSSDEDGHSSSSASSIAAAPTPRHAGPTVVRLDDSEGEESDDAASSSGSGGPTYVATRGRGRGRGRGHGASRGRGRGRPRGRPRGS